VVPVRSTFRTESLAFLPTEWPHGKGQQQVLFDDPFEPNGILFVMPTFKVFHLELDLFALDTPLFQGMQDLANRSNHRVMELIQTSAAFKGKGGPGLALHNDVPAPCPNQQMPARSCLQREAFQAFPGCVLAAKGDTHSLLWNLRTLYLHCFGALYTPILNLSYYLFVLVHVKPTRQLTACGWSMILGEEEPDGPEEERR
jgi:hypothetical protein